MDKMLEKLLVNLPSDVQLLVSSGRSTLYRLPKKYADRGVYLLAISRSDTFFVSEDGIIGNKAGALGEIEVDEVVRLPHSNSLSSFKHRPA